MTGPTDPTTPGGATHPDQVLAGYVDGTLDPAEREEVERHLAGCTTCREELALSRRARAGLAALPELDVPVGVTRPVVDGARRGGVSRLARITAGGEPHRSSRVAQVAWGAGAAAAAAVIAVFAWSAVNGGNPVRTAATAPKEARGGGGRGLALAPTVRVTHQSIDYDAASIQALATRIAGEPGAFNRATVPSPAASPGSTAPAAPLPTHPSTATLGSAGAPSSTPLPPVACVQYATGSAPSFRLVRLLQATFEGTPAYIAVYAGSSEPGRPTDLVTVWVVSTSECSLLNYTSTAIP
jgi:hypothetical protein